MKRPTKAQRVRTKEAMHEAHEREKAQDRKAQAIAYIPGKVPPEPLPTTHPHVIQIPIWRAVIVGEKLDPATDVKCGTWGIEQIPRDLVNTVFNGQYLYFRRVTTVPLTIHVS